MTKRFKTLMRNGKFVALSGTCYLRDSENPEIFHENATIRLLKENFRKSLSEYSQWAIDAVLSDLDQCELVTIEVKVVNDIPELVKTDKTSSE